MYKLSPSKAHRYLYCTASLQFDTEFKETPATIRGTLLHKISELMLDNQNVTEMVVENNLSEYELNLITNYVKTVLNETARLDGKCIIEQKVEVDVHGEKINLIMDACIVGNSDEATIIDLKTGNGDVSPERNEQLLFYGFALLRQHPNLKKINLDIYQKMKLKVFTVDRDYILDFIFDIEPVFEKIKNNELEFNPGEKQCVFCEHKDKCVARAHWILNRKEREE